ncbi:hypothetical protein X975_03150, partial [Stegodyphus mimosarum]
MQITAYSIKCKKKKPLFQYFADATSAFPHTSKQWWYQRGESMDRAYPVFAIHCFEALAIPS